MTGDIYT